MLQRSPSAEHPLNSEALRCQIFRRPARGRSRRCGCRRNRLFAPSRGCRRRFRERQRLFRLPISEAFPSSWSQTRPELAVAIMAGPSSNACGRDCHFARRGGRENRCGLRLRAPSRCGRLVGSSGSSGTQAQSRYASAGSVRFRSRSERVMAGQRQGKRHRSCQRRALPALSRPRPATAKLAAKLASLNFGVRFGRSIANAITLPILMAGERAAQCRS